MRWTDEAKLFCPKGLAGNVPFVKWMGEKLGNGLLVDVGANVGAVCIATLLQAKPGARAVAFEPQTRAADALTRMVALNEVNVKLYREAISSWQGEAVLKFPVDVTVSGWGSIADKPDFFEAKNSHVDVSSEVVSVTTLDDWWREADKPDVQVLKCDAQGAEVDVLMGGVDMFTKTVPYLFIECHGPTLKEHGHTISDLKTLLSNMGFTFEYANKNNLRCERGR